MIKIRPYRSTDASTVVAWIAEEREFFQWCGNRFGTYPMSAEEFNGCFDGQKGEDDFQMTALDETGVIGFFNVHFCDRESSSVVLDSVIIQPQKRGRGIGKRMIRSALKYLFEILGAETVYIDVFDLNDKAYHCFKNSGFYDQGSPVKQYRFHEETWDCKRMMLKKGDPQEAKREDSVYPEERIVDEIIDKNCFSYAFQPIVSAANGEIYGYEALMRADYGGPVSPSVILKHATNSHRLYDIERLTFQNVLERVEKDRELFCGRRVFVNSIPGFQLKDEDYQILTENRKEMMQQITIEITEETDINDLELEVLLKRGKEDGFQIAIDDYGTGYSNTSSLLRCVPNCIKMDRLLISNIHEEVKKQHFVKSIVEFAHNNGILALAEGVETVAELRCVIEMGVDLIQGFFTARPSFTILQEVDEKVRNEILNVNVRGQTPESRRVFVVDNEKELPLMRLTLEKYTGILLSKGEFTLVGNMNYVAAMSVKIKENSDVHLTIRNVCMESFLELPCIDIGKGAHLTLKLEGENRLRKLGICVPEGSCLTVIGDGNLSVRAQSRESYAIGNSWDGGVGNIDWQSYGTLSIFVEADKGIGIGGGYRKGEGKISFVGGSISVEAASKEAIAIGCVNDGLPIQINRCNMEVNLRNDIGIGIGSLYGDQDTSVIDSRVVIVGSGNDICGIGSVECGGGKISLERCGGYIEMNGQTIKLLGNKGGGLAISMRDAAMQFKAEGKSALGIGCADMSAEIYSYHFGCDMVIRSSEFITLGARQENIKIIGGAQNISANG